MLQLIVLTFLFFIFSYLLYLFWYQNYSHQFKLLKQLPSPPGYPLLGNLFHFFTSQEQIFKLDHEISKKYQPIYLEWSFTYASVNLFHPDDIEAVISSTKNLSKGDVYDLLHAWLGTGLLTSGGSKWQQRRKILTPAFHFNILQQFVPIFNKGTQNFVAELKRKQGKETDVIPEVTKFTLLAITETSMGVKLDEYGKNFEAYRSSIHTMGSILVYRIFRPWLLSDYIFYNFCKFGNEARKSLQHLHSFSKNVISQRKSSFQESQKKRMAMLDLLLCAKNQGLDIDDKGIQEEVDTFIFEGHDTTALAISYTLLVLANYPNIQEQVYQELQTVLPIPTDSPTYTELKQLTFLERVLKETLRLFPSVPVISRTLSEDLWTKSGFLLPKQTVVNIQIFDVHRNPEIYPNPEKFDPDRFLTENCTNRHPFAYLPFSAGPRNCIGQKYAMLELKSVICGVVREFILEAVDGIEDLVFLTDLVLRSKNAVRIKFKPRIN